MSFTRRRLLQLGAGLPFAGSALSFLSTPAFAAAKIQRVISPGGIEAWLVQDATVPLVALEYSFNSGSAQDPADKAGTGSFTANMLDEGAADLDSKTFHDRLERRAIEMNFNVTRDYLRGSMRMLKENRDEAFGLLKLALTDARFDAEPLERVRSQMLSNARRETTNPVAIAGRKFWEQAYGAHPYARPSNGTVESLSTIQAADLKDYAKRTLARDTLKVAVVGDIEADALGKLLDTAFSALPAKANLTPVPEAVFGRLPQHSFLMLDVPQTSINFGAPAVARSDPDFMAAYIVNHILGGGTLSTRLYREVREKRGLVYSVSESLIWMKKSSIFAGSTATRADKATEDTRHHLHRDRAHGRRRPDPEGTGRGQILPQGFADAGARHLVEIRHRPPSVPERRSRHRLHREAQWHRRRGHARRRQTRRPANLGPGSPERQRRPRHTGSGRACEKIIYRA